MTKAKKAKKTGTARVRVSVVPEATWTASTGWCDAGVVADDEASPRGHDRRDQGREAASKPRKGRGR